MSIQEVSDVVVDAYAFELRVGDRVRLVFADDAYATVEAIELPSAILREGDVMEAATPPRVTIRLDNGERMTCEGQYLRTPVWRWTINEVRR